MKKLQNKLHIADMLCSQPRHISFHTPGHKKRGGDITELDYSDNLYAPTGVIALAERDIAESALQTAFASTGYRVVSVASEPYEKKGFFHFGR